jgi:hypothetical protein
MGFQAPGLLGLVIRELQTAFSFRDTFQNCVTAAEFNTIVERGEPTGGLAGWTECELELVRKDVG